MKKYLFLLWIILNIIVFFVYAADKHKAKKGKWRISEATLMLCAVFGCMGALSGMYVFHHKTRKPKFRFGVPAIIILEAAAAGFLNYYS